MDFEVFNWLRLVELPPTHLTIVVLVQLSSFGTTAVFVFVIYRPVGRKAQQEESFVMELLTYFV